MHKLHLNNWLKAFIIAFAILVFLPLLFKNVAIKQFNNYLSNLSHTTVTHKFTDLQWFRHFPHFTFVVKDLHLSGYDNFDEESSLDFGTIRLKLDIWDMLFKRQVKIKNICIENANINLTKKNGSFGFKGWGMSENNRNDKFSLNRLDFRHGNLIITDADNKLKYELNNINSTLRRTTKNKKTTYTIKSKEGFFSVSRNGLYIVRQSALASNINFSYDLSSTHYKIESSNLSLNNLSTSFEGEFSLNDTHSFIVVDGNSHGILKEMLSVWSFFYENNFEKLNSDGLYDISYFYELSWGKSFTEQYDIALNAKNGSIRYDGKEKSIEAIDITVSVCKKIEDDALFAADISFTTEKSNFKTKLYNSKESNERRVFSNNFDIFFDFTEWDDIFTHSFSGDLHTFAAKLNFEGNYNPHAPDAEKITSKGYIALNGFTYQGSNDAPAIHIDTAHIVFENNSFYMTEFYSCIGNSTFEAKGEWHNFFGFMTGNAYLEGDWQITSKYFEWNEFFTDADNASAFSHFHIPDNINLSLFVDVDTLNVNGAYFENFKTHMEFGNGMMLIRNSDAQLNDGRCNLKGIYLNSKEADAAYYFSLIYKNIDASDIMKVVGFIDSNDVHISGAINAQLDINSNDGFREFLKHVDLISLSSYDNLLTQADSEIIAFFKMEAPALTGHIDFFESLSEALKIPVINNGLFEDICIKMRVNNTSETVECFGFRIKDVLFEASIEKDVNNNQSLRIDIIIPVKYFEEEQAYKRLKEISDRSGKHMAGLLRKEHITFSVFPNEKLEESGIIVKQ